MLPDPSAPGLIPSIPSIPEFIFRGNKIVNVAEGNQWRWLEESGQWLESVDLNHLVLASGKLVLPKKS